MQHPLHPAVHPTPVSSVVSCLSTQFPDGRAAGRWDGSALRSLTGFLARSSSQGSVIPPVGAQPAPPLSQALSSEHSE